MSMSRRLAGAVAFVSLLALGGCAPSFGFGSHPGFPGASYGPGLNLQLYSSTCGPLQRASLGGPFTVSSTASQFNLVRRAGEVQQLAQFGFSHEAQRALRMQKLPAGEC